MSDSVRPHRWQPTRFPHPWDSPGKNTGVGCHFLLQCVKVKSLSRVRLLATSWTAAYQAPSSMGFSRQEYWSGVPLPCLNTGMKIFFVYFHFRIMLQHKYWYGFSYIEDIFKCTSFTENNLVDCRCLFV